MLNKNQLGCHSNKYYRSEKSIFKTKLPKLQSLNLFVRLLLYGYIHRHLYNCDKTGMNNKLQLIWLRLNVILFKASLAFKGQIFEFRYLLFYEHAIRTRNTFGIKWIEQLTNFNLNQSNPKNKVVSSWKSMFSIKLFYRIPVLVLWVQWSHTIHEHDHQSSI